MIGSTSPELPQSGVADSQRLEQSHVVVARTSGRLFSLNSGRLTGTTAPSNLDSRLSDLVFENFAREQPIDVGRIATMRNCLSAMRYGVASL
jgi:hypothetical protein